VGDHLVFEARSEEQTELRDVGVCTERWVELIKASKQTDTYDLNGESESERPLPLLRPSPDRVVLERRSSLGQMHSASPPPSRKTSLARYCSFL
jgi:hypothetical protein